MKVHNVFITKFQVRAKVSLLKSGKAIKDIGQMSPCNSDTVVIIGGGPSGATCAETLRHEGYTGRVVIIAKEKYLPYDRIKVSKIGVVPEIEKLQVRSQEYYDNSQIEIFKGVEATGIEPKHKYVTLSDGNRIPYSSVYIATGSKPRVPDILGVDAKNVFTVRNYEDSINILAALGNSRFNDLVVLGLSFIGLEIAASCFDKAKSVTVVGTDKAPLNHVFGLEIGAALRKLYEEKGVKFHFETTITKCVSSNGAISSVHLSNGKVLSADVLVLGVGTTFNTEFLQGAKINTEANGAVKVNEKLETNVANIYAGGDIAHAPVFAAGNQHMTIGHIGLAQYHGRVAALNILKMNTPVKVVPYFFSQLFGKSIRYAGYGRPASTLIDGEVDGLKFLMYFFDEDEKVIAVASCMRDPVVSQFAEFTHQGKVLYKKDLKENPVAWTKAING